MSIENNPIKKEIDEMSYYEMLKLQRFSKSGHMYFTGLIGEYFAKVMQEKKEALPAGESVRISKQIGW